MNPAVIYDEFKLLSFAGGYVVCHARSLQDGFWTLDAVVVAPMGRSTSVGAFCGREMLPSTPLDDDGEFKHLLLRLRGTGTVVTMTLRVPAQSGASSSLRWRDLDSGRPIGCAYHLPSTASV